MTGKERNVKSGIIFGLSAYLLWGLLPIYWKWLDGVRPEIVLSHRIIWSFIFMVFFIFVTKKTKEFIKQCKYILQRKKTMFALTAASIIISSNWLIFIWAVHHDHVVESSLGYYINPLMSVLLGVFVLKEKLSKAQITSFILAGIGVTYLTFSYGVFPWVSIALAATFSIYGLVKKLVNLNATFSLTLETLIITPITLIFLIFTTGIDLGFAGESASTIILLILSGVATAVPLLLFGIAVLHLPLSMAGFLQYIAPTIMLFLGVFLYGEDFTTAHLITFTLIWISLILFMASSLKQNRKSYKEESKIEHHTHKEISRMTKRH